MASPHRRATQNYKSSNTQQSRSSSQSSTGSQSTAPTYMVEEDSHGELVNRRMGIVWPMKVHAVQKRYPDHSSGQSVATSDGEDQFKTSPYEMISIADLNAAAAAASAERIREKRAADSGRSRDNRSSRTSSPPYVSLSSRSEEASGHETDECTAKIDSVVFDTAEELDRYQKLFRAGTQARSANTVTNNVLATGEREETDRHYIGVRSRRAIDKKLTPGQFFIYYEKPKGVDIPVSIELKIGYMSSTSKIYHFPIQRFVYQDEPFYAVMQTDTDVKMFSSIAELVQHYNNFSHVDPETGRLETLGLPV